MHTGRTGASALSRRDLWCPICKTAPQEVFAVFFRRFLLLLVVVCWAKVHTCAQSRWLVYMHGQFWRCDRPSDRSDAPRKRYCSTHYSVEFPPERCQAYRALDANVLWFVAMISCALPHKIPKIVQLLCAAVAVVSAHWAKLVLFDAYCVNMADSCEQWSPVLRFREGVGNCPNNLRRTSFRIR